MSEFKLNLETFEESNLIKNRINAFFINPDNILFTEIETLWKSFKAHVSIRNNWIPKDREKMEFETVNVKLTNDEKYDLISNRLDALVRGASSQINVWVAEIELLLNSIKEKMVTQSNIG